MTYNDSYPTEPIGGGNPYRRCKSCGRSMPAINGRLEGHHEDCAWRISQTFPYGITQKSESDASLPDQMAQLAGLAGLLGLKKAADFLLHLGFPPSS